MAEEQPQSLPPELDGWLAERAAETGRERAEVLARAVATYRLLADADDPTGVAPLDERIDELADRLDELETDTDDRIEDVRDRVVQVMQTARSKADADHEHPELAERAADAAAEAAAADEEVAELRRALAELDRRVDGGFQNYETVLSSLVDRADEADEKLDTLAGAVVSLRARAAELEADRARREALAEFTRDANVRGVRAGDCENCGERVDIGLLSAPRCPHCREPFDGVEPGRRFFGTATLLVGDRPALAGAEYEPEDPAEVFEPDE